MKTPRPDSDSRWADLLRQARADAPPPVNVPVLLQAMRAAEPRREDWAMEFFVLFTPVRSVLLCLAGAGACAVLASWELWDLSQTLPWAQLLAVTGGVP